MSSEAKYFRWLVFSVVVGLIAGATVLDSFSSPENSDGDSSDAAAVVNPSLGNPARLDSAWYCPIGSTVQKDGYADHEVIITNLGDQPAVASLQILAGTAIEVGEPGEIGTPEAVELPSFGSGSRIDVAPGATERVQLSESGEAAQASAVVEVVGGRAVVAHRVDTLHGIAEGPCASHVSSSWYFAGGRTQPDAKEYLALMNPFPEAAVFDVKFQTLVRDRAPGKLQGAFVAPQSVRLIEVGEFMPREDIVATTVTAQRGRLVVERLQLLNGEAGPRGAALQLGVPTPTDLWTFTSGVVTATGEQNLIIYYPAKPEEPVSGESEDDAELEVIPPAEVNITLWPIEPTDQNLYGITQITREIEPGSFEVVDLVAQAERFQLPLPYPLTVVVFSTDPEVELVAERWQFSKPVSSSLAAAPTDTPPPPEGSEITVAPSDVDAVIDSRAQKVQEVANQGFATSRGIEQFSERWVVPWVTASDTSSAGVIAVWSPKTVDDSEVGSFQVKAWTNGTSVDIEPKREIKNSGGELIAFSAPDGAVIEVVSSIEVAVEAYVVELDKSVSVVPGVPTEN